MLIWIGREAIPLVADLRERYVVPEETIVPRFHRGHLDALIKESTQGTQVVLCRPNDEAVEWLQGVTYRYPNVTLARISGAANGNGRDTALPTFTPGDAGLDRLAEHMDWPARVQTIRIAPISYKGGSGKTVVLSNLAAALSQQGRSILLIEGDVTDDNVRRLTGAASSPSLNQLVTEHTLSELSHGHLRDHVQPWEGVPGVDVLVAVHGDSDRTLQRPSAASAVLRAADGLYDYVLVDLPADNQYSSSFAAAILDMEDTVRRQFFLVIAAYGVTEIEGADRALNLLRRRCAALVPAHNVGIVVNRVRTPIEALDDYVAQLSDTYEVPIAARLPDVGEEMQLAGLASLPLLRYERDLSATERFRQRSRLQQIDTFREEMRDLATFIEDWRQQREEVLNATYTG